MIESLRIERFRGIREGHLPELARVNVFIGPNGSGKSTILEAVCLLASQYSGQDLLAADRQQEMRSKRNERLPIASGWWYAHDQEMPIKSMIKVDGVDCRMEIKRNPNGHGTSTDCHPRPHDGNPMVQRLTSIFQKLLFLDAERALRKEVEKQLWGPAFLSKRHRILLRLFRTIYGIEAQNVTFNPGEDDIIIDIDPTPLRLDDLGTGMRMSFRILLSALCAGTSALLLEEFDAYQYKTSLFKLAEALSDVAAENQTQLFLTTHSLESVHAFLEGSKNRGEDWIRVFPLSLGADGILKTHGMGRADAQRLLDAGLDLREISSSAP